MGALALLLPFARDLIGKLLPDPQAQAAAQLRLAEMAHNGELAQLAADSDNAKGQLAVNTAEAARAGREWITWREAFGWICVIAVACKLVLGPMVAMVCSAAGHPIELPEIELKDMWPALMGMLGLGALKTIEKVKGAT